MSLMRTDCLALVGVAFGIWSAVEGQWGVTAVCMLLCVFSVVAGDLNDR